jgi:hypothetical protein
LLGALERMTTAWFLRRVYVRELHRLDEVARSAEGGPQRVGEDETMRETSASDREPVIAAIVEAFGGNEYPGDQWLQGSFDGCEPFEEISAFFGRTDWRALEPEFLDGHYTALSFFSEAGLRFFLPAYLVADVRGHLQTADPLFHLTHGFGDHSIGAGSRSRELARSSGPSPLINPRRYGAVTFLDYARYRLSAFTREEAGAVVAYLRFRRRVDDLGLDTRAVDAALASFWLERLRTAPTADALTRHLERQEEYRAALESRDHGAH